MDPDVITVTPLGAGQDVGRSCIIVEMGGKRIMLDCGMHMGFEDHRQFPDFTRIPGRAPGQSLNEVIDLVIISHFHLDHCGALPTMTEQDGYTGPIVMTAPTKSITPLLLEDFRHIMVNHQAKKDFFTSQDVANCMDKVTSTELHQVLRLEEDFEIQTYYAGHVLGAAMYHIRVGKAHIVYTGDFNTTPDQHLRGAWIERLNPDVLITESTYATTIRQSKRYREQEFLWKIKHCVTRGSDGKGVGGKVLIPVFALGRAQELCLLLDGFWAAQGLEHVPIYFTAGMAQKATELYKEYTPWMSEFVQHQLRVHDRNVFDFKNIRPFERQLLNHPGPMVVFATPGMLHAGLSLQLFRHWAQDPKNLCILAGYCVQGTVGNQVICGERLIRFEDGGELNVRCEIANLSFSAHADAAGIMRVVDWCDPAAVVLVHGEAQKMKQLKTRMKRQFPGVPVEYPANHSTATFPVQGIAPGLRACRRPAAEAVFDAAAEEVKLEELGLGGAEAEPFWSEQDQAEGLGEEAEAGGNRKRQKLDPFFQELHSALRDNAGSLTHTSFEIDCVVSPTPQLIARVLNAQLPRDVLDQPLQISRLPARFWSVEISSGSPLLRVDLPNCLLRVSWHIEDRDRAELVVVALRNFFGRGYHDPKMLQELTAVAEPPAVDVPTAEPVSVKKEEPHRCFHI